MCSQFRQSTFLLLAALLSLLPSFFIIIILFYTDSDGEEECQTTAEFPETTEPGSNSDATSRCSEVSSPVDCQPLSAVEQWTIQGSDNVRMS